MAPSDRGPLGSVLSAAWVCFIVALLLWLAVWLIQQIWIWLLLLGIVVTTVFVGRWWLRRDRW